MEYSYDEKNSVLVLCSFGACVRTFCGNNISPYRLHNENLQGTGSWNVEKFGEVTRQDAAHF